MFKGFEKVHLLDKIALTIFFFFNDQQRELFKDASKVNNYEINSLQRPINDPGKFDINLEIRIDRSAETLEQRWEQQLLLSNTTTTTATREISTSTEIRKFAVASSTPSTNTNASQVFLPKPSLEDRLVKLVSPKKK